MLNSDDGFNLATVFTQAQVFNNGVGEPFELTVSLILGFFQHFHQNGIGVVGHEAGGANPATAGVELAVFCFDPVSEFFIPLGIKQEVALFF